MESKGGLKDFDPQNYASEHVTIEEVLGIKKSFDIFDRDGSGSIDPKELKTSINSLGIQIKASSIYTMVAELDEDASGNLEFNQFFSMMTKSSKSVLKQLAIVAKQLGQLGDDAVLRAMIEKADLDGDGVISQEEFQEFVTKTTY